MKRTKKGRIQLYIVSSLRSEYSYHFSSPLFLKPNIALRESTNNLVLFQIALMVKIIIKYSSNFVYSTPYGSRRTMPRILYYTRELN